MSWRFEPARIAGRAVEATFVGAVRFELRPKDERAIEGVVRQAFDNWIEPAARESVKKTPRMKVREREVTPTSILEERLVETFGAARESAAQVLGVDAIQFEGDDAWVTTTLRRAGEDAPGAVPDAHGSASGTMVRILVREASGGSCEDGRRFADPRSTAVRR